MFFICLLYVIYIDKGDAMRQRIDKEIITQRSPKSMFIFIFCYQHVIYIFLCFFYAKNVVNNTKKKKK